MSWFMVLYGMEWPDDASLLTVEVWCFGNRDCSDEERWGHFVRAVDLAFNCMGSVRRVVWNDWLERQVREYIGAGRKGFVGVAGSSSSGKSDGFALYGLMCYWSRPVDTYVIVMSTTKSGARKRVWKSVTQMWGQAERMGCPGKLLDSLGIIKGVDALGKLTGNSGIELVAAGKADVGEACSNLIGIKAPQVIVGADEMPDLGDGITAAVSGNLRVNDRVLLAGLGNPNMFGDPFGDLCEPAAGWKSVSEFDLRWATKWGGTCIRLDAESSPRIVEPDGEKYFWQPDQEYIDGIASQRGGKKSRAYYRFVKAFWCPEGQGNTVYSESELVMGRAMDELEPRWDGPPTLISALDPSFTRGGDRSCWMVSKVGKVDGRAHMHIVYEGVLQEDLNSGMPLTHQYAQEWHMKCEEWGVAARCAVMDGSGSGISFGHVVDVEWSPAVEKVNFGAKASDRVVLFRGEEISYYNKNSELWIQPKEFVRSGQISGMSKELVAELVSREHHEKDGKVLRVESKADAKKKLNGVSPDLADAFLMMVDKALTLGIFPSEEVKKVGKSVGKSWRQLVKKRQVSNPLGRRLRR